LWILDTGSINFAVRAKRGAKLIGIDLNSNKIVKEFVFPDDVATLTSYLNDVRFDLKRGPEGTAYITDSSSFGANAILVVDLATGKSMRRLNRHPSTLATEQFIPHVEGEAMMARVPGQPEAFMKIGADGIAISPDGKTLYYCPLATRRWFSVSTDALADPAATDAQIAATVKEMPAREFASDGLESDAAGRIYLTDYENNAIRRFTPGTSTFETLVADPKLIWPDSLALTPDGFLYVTSNQLNRQPNYQNGTDKRQRPFVLFRIKTDGQAIRTPTR
jgi:sugar lactone lactonase YvrE